MNYVSELLQDYPPTMSARLLAFLLTMESGKPEDEYRCLKDHPQLTMRTHVRALAAIVDHSAKNGDEDGAFALGVKLCNLRAAAKWGIEHYQRRMQGEGIDAVYRGVTLPQGARSINEVMKRFEREQRRDDLERRHAQLAKVYPTLYGSAAEGEAAVGGQDGGAQDVAAEGKGNIFKKEFGHCPGPPGRLSALSVSLCKPFFYGASVWRAGRLAAKNGGFRPGQCRTRRRSGSARTASGWARPSACSRCPRAAQSSVHHPVYLLYRITK
jgi:hypothetical protein